MYTMSSESIHLRPGKCRIIVLRGSTDWRIHPQYQCDGGIEESCHYSIDPPERSPTGELSGQKDRILLCWNLWILRRRLQGGCRIQECIRRAAGLPDREATLLWGAHNRLCRHVDVCALALHSKCSSTYERQFLGLPLCSESPRHMQVKI